MKSLAVALPLLAVVLGAPATSLASDHSDGPSTLLDRTADLSDLYTFTSPKDPDKVVMVMNVLPFASRESRFSDKVDYRFRIRPIDDVKTLVPSRDPKKERSIICSFTGEAVTQRATCKFNLVGGTETVELATRSDAFAAGGSAQKGDIRVFAGVRSDSWFLDLERTSDFVNNSLGIDTTAPGRNGLAGTNVLTIVVEVSKRRLPGPLVAVTAQTARR